MEKQQKKVFLDINHVFGSNFSESIKNEIGLIEQDQHIKLVYTAGKTIVKKNIDSNHMEFIRLSDNIQRVQCMAISPNKNHISICEKIKNESFLLLNLYGLKTRDSEIKHFKLPQTEKQSSFKIIAFSPSQPKYVCCMTSEPENQLMFLDISRSRGLAVSNFSVEGTSAVSICSTQSHLISCSGKNIFKLFKVEDYSFKPYNEIKKLPKTRNFITHSWFDKTKILVGTDRGELFMVGPVGNNFEVKKHFNNVFAIESPQEQIGVSSICVFSKGFILGSNHGNFSLWIKQQQNEQNFQDQYTGDLIKKWSMPYGQNSEVTSIAICPKQHNVAVSFKNNNIALANMDILLNDEEYLIDNNKISLSNKVLTLMYDGFHVNSIDYMDVCMHRPLIATLSKKDNTIRIWNYKKPNCELIKKFEAKSDGIQELGVSELVNCLAFHPLGYYMAIGCCDKLRVYHILEDSFRIYREIVLKGVIQLKFSNGGHMLAAAYPRQKHNIHLINIYNSYTLEEIASLSDHSNLITQLTWRHDDKFLYSCGTDGTISEWKHTIESQPSLSLKEENTNPSLNSKEWTCKKWNQNNSKYSSIMHQKESNIILSAGSELNKFVIREIKLNREKDQIQKLFTMNFRISKLEWLTSQWNIPAIIAGTDQGSIKVFNSTFDNIVEQSLNVHNKEITHIKTSPCGRYLFSTSKDGLLFIFQISLTNREGYVNKRLHDQGNDYELNPLIGVLDDDLASVVLVQRNDINEKIRYTKLLQKNLEDMKRRLIMQDDDENRKYEMELKGLQDVKQARINELNEQYEKHKKEKKELESFFRSNFIDTQSKNDKMLEDIQNLYEKKLSFENRRYFQLEKVYDAEQASQVAEIKKISGKSQFTIELLKKQFIECFRKAEKIHLNQQETLNLDEKSFQEKVGQIEEEHENELRKISQSISEIETQKNKKSSEYVNMIESLKRECRSLNDEIIAFMSENQHLKQVHKESNGHLISIVDEMHSKKQQLMEKQENLKARETKIGIFQEKITELQKKKQVLSYRTWEMRQQIEPKEDQIEFLKGQIFSLESEFEKLLNDEKVIEELQLKIKRDKEFLNTNISHQKSQTKDIKIKVKKICDDINSIVETKSTDKRFYEDAMKKLSKKYVNLMTDKKKNNRNMKGVEEMNRHIDHLDQEIVEINQKTEVTIKKREQEIQKSTQQNADLIKELATFRTEKTQLAEQLKKLHKAVDSLKRQTVQLKGLVEGNATTGKIDGFNPKSTKKDSINKSTQIKTLSSLKHAPNMSANKPINPINSVNEPLFRSSSQSSKGKLVKGINYDTESLSIFSKAKIKQLERKLEMTKLELTKRETMAKTMKKKIRSHLHEENCQDSYLEKTIAEYEI